jgi:glucuronate isomerase
MPGAPRLHFLPDRYFDPDPQQKAIAQHLYSQVVSLPLVCPHGHVDARLFADPDCTFGTPTEMLILPDHYILRMLYSQGVRMEQLGVPRRDGEPVETDHRRIWQTFAEHIHLFWGTPTGAWLTYELYEVFGIRDKLTADTAQRIYDEIADRLRLPAFQPRALYERFNIEVLCTTDGAADTLEPHHAIRVSGWHGRILPTFRPDAVINLNTPGWRSHVQALGAACGHEIRSYADFIRALEARRTFFKSMGARATDHAAVTPYTAQLSAREAEAIFQRALQGTSGSEDAIRFTGHMLIEMARMSVEDGLVMQLHVGAQRDHNRLIYERFGPDRGGDIPVQVEFTRNLSALLNRFGSDARLTLILFTLDEQTYARELAPLAGHYPALRLGPPWWFHDSLNGMRRYFDTVMETAGLYNTVGFNDDTRAFPSIPARHDLWRRAAANWIAGLNVRGIVDLEDAETMIVDVAYRLPKRAYRLG